MTMPQTVYIARNTPGLASLVELLQATIDDNGDKFTEDYAAVITQPTLTVSGEIALRSMVLPAHLAMAISHILKHNREVQS